MTLLDVAAGLSPLGADLLLCVGLFTILVADLIMPPGEKRVFAWATLATLAAALVGTFVLDLSGDAVRGAYRGDALALFFKRVFLGAALITTLGSMEHVSRRFARRQAEFYLLLLCSVLGMSLLAGARELILLLVAFELMSIPLYVLLAFPRRQAAATEGALKLFLTGAVSSAVVLYGVALLSGLAGSSSIEAVAAHVQAHPSPLAALAALLAVGGMGFKIGVFPFHMWVPDAYEGGSTPVVAFLSSAPKAAGLVALVQVLLSGEQALLAGATLPLIGIAVATLAMGNLLAIQQSNIKRLLAYSGVAHMGFVVVALAIGEAEALATLLFYVAAYVFTSLGAFLVVHAVDVAGGDGSIRSFNGLGRRSGWLGIAMLTFLLSLGGIPFVVGFWAKLYVFLAAWSAGLTWFVVLGALLSVLALFYYMRVARAMYMEAPATSAPEIRADFSTHVGIALCLVLVVGMGLWPRPVIEAAQVAALAFLP